MLQTMLHLIMQNLQKLVTQGTLVTLGSQHGIKLNNKPPAAADR